LNNPGIRGIFIGFGLLDLLSFYRAFPTLTLIFENYDVPAAITNVLPALAVLLIVSFLVSGPLTIVGNRYGYVMYYFQFPLRLAVQIPTFGFAFELFPMQVGTFYQGMFVATVVAFEAIRLMLTIQHHRKLSLH
jgi:hypothetical protein